MVPPTVAAAICRQPAARPESWYVRIRNNQTRNVCHSDRSVSGVEESTTWDDEPPQDEICYLSRFLDSLRSLGMTCRGWFPFNRTGCIRNGASPCRGWMALGQRRYIVPYMGNTIHPHRPIKIPFLRMVPGYGAFSRPHPYGMRSGKRGLSPELKKCPLDTFLPAFGGPLSSSPITHHMWFC